MPYLFGAGTQARDHGTPVLRAMHLEFPDDPGCDTLDRQYMLGESLLVAPVFTHDGTVDVYVPAGRWTHFLTGEVFEGGRWIKQRHDFLSLPLLARPNSIIAVGANDQRPDYDFADGVTFHIFELDDGASASAAVPTLEGGVAITVTARREGQWITVEATGATKPWSVLLRGSAIAHVVEGGTSEPDPLGARITPADGAAVVKVVL